MDVDELIAQVFRRGPIWDKRLKQHSNRVYIDKCWKDIATEMKTEDSVLRKKWKYLRDQYSAELSKITRPKSGAGADEIVTCKWQYFNGLSFLKDIVKPRQSSGNCSTFKGSNTCEISEQRSDTPEIAGEEECIGSENMAQVQLQNDDSVNEGITTIDDCFEGERKEEDTPRVNKVTKHKVQRVKRIRNEDYASSMLEIERILSQKRKSREENEPEDEHLLFFKTLLPHVKKIRPEQIFPFRTRIQDVVQQFAYPLSYSFGSTPRTNTPFSPAGTSNNSTAIEEYEVTQVSVNEDFSGLTSLLNLK